MRIAVGSLMQETNTFVPFKTTVETFENVYIHRGDAVLTDFGDTRTEVPAFLHVLREAGAEIVPLLAAMALASGPVERTSFDFLLNDLVARLRAAGPVDAVLLALHGALVVEDASDGDAEIVGRVRAALPPGTPIGVSLDLHGHITSAMLQPDVFYVGYQEYPHIDQWETGERTARLLLEVLAGQRHPVMALTKRPLLVSPVNARTGNEPLATIVRAARAMEEAGEVLHASVFPVQPWMDVPDLGFAVLVCADKDQQAAQRAADRLADMAWQARAQFEPDLVPLDEAIQTGLTSEGLTTVGDVGDSPSGGSAADSGAVLRALLAAGADRGPRLSLLTTCDPEAAAEAAKAGVGATVTLRIGHKRTRDGEPLTVTGRVKTVTDGDFTMHDAGAQGLLCHLGLTAVLAIGAIRLVIRSLPAFEWDTGVYTSAGLDLREAALVFVKSPSHFRVAYTPLSDRVLIADTPGTTCANMRRIPFRNVTRPLYPLDDINSQP
jgi:microcystin degradation protein MlrC